MEFNADGYLGLHFKTQGKKSYAHLSSRSKHPMSCSTVDALVIYHCCSAQSRHVVGKANGMLARHYFDWLIGSRRPGFTAWFGCIQFDSFLNVFSASGYCGFHLIVLCISIGCVFCRPIYPIDALNKLVAGQQLAKAAVTPIWSFAAILRLFQLLISTFHRLGAWFLIVVVAMTLVLKRKTSLEASGIFCITLLKALRKSVA